MIKYNLKCKNEHEFESWFSDSNEFENLKKRKLLECIFCSSKKINKSSFISQGDDYQILFTANKAKSRIINKTAKSLGIKISKIGKICSNKKKSLIIDQKGNKIAFMNRGYYHQF